MATPTERLDAMLIDFDRRTATGTHHPGPDLRRQLDATPELKARVLDAIAKGQLNAFNPLPAGSGAGASYDEGSRSIQLPIATLARAMTSGAARAELVFTMGHEIQHSFNRGVTSRANDAFDERVATITSAPTPHNYTRAVGDYIATYRNNEASAHIGGFNALVSQVRREHPGATLKDVYYAHPGRMQDFIAVSGEGPNKQYHLRPGLTVDKTTLQMSETSGNVESVARHFFDKPRHPPNGLGSHRDQNYREYYASAALKRILQIENWAHTNAIARDPTHPRALVQLDTAALGVNPAALHTGTFFQDLSHARTPAGGVQAAPLPTSRSTALQGAALPIAEASIPRTDAPLFSQAVAALDRLGPRSGITSHEELSAVAAAMAVRAQHDGLTRIDLVVGSADGRRLFAVEGNPASPDSRRSDIDRIHAASQPVEANLARLQSVDTAPTAVEHTHQHGQGKSR